MNQPHLGRSPPWWVRRVRPLIAWLLLGFAVAVVAIAVLDGLTARWTFASSESRKLDASSTAEGYEAVVIEYAREIPDMPAPENYSIWPLRTQLLIDSLVLEPAYAGLLLLYGLALRRLAGRGAASEGWDWPFQLMCLLLAAGVMYDLAENGMIVRAAEDGLWHLLAQPTMVDVHDATRLKWTFLGAATLMIGLFARDRRIPPVRPWLGIGAWAAIIVAPLAAIQGVRLRFGTPLDGVLTMGLFVAFGVALVALGRAVWQLSDAIPREAVANAD
ncbi:MAG TPA: hypothetical protein VMU47_06890 [Caldimonas sp.]|nr:hypothetical protein [Caldimonas sp.]